MEENVKGMKKKIVENSESIGFEEIAERAGPDSKEEYIEMKNIQKECSERIETLLNLK